jgi:Mrp family chromosome partitioning ATPase
MLHRQAQGVNVRRIGACRIDRSIPTGSGTHSAFIRRQCYDLDVNCSPQRRSTAITVINLKGGVGKTHTVWLLAGVCQKRGKKLLVIDTDTQGNITKSLLAPAWNPIPGVAALFDPRTNIHPGNLIRPTRYTYSYTTR